MNDEPTFFDEGGKVLAFARRTDPDTSHEAAEQITPMVRALQIAVLEYAARCVPLGFTDPAMNEHFGVTSSTYRTRRAELVDMGMIADTGERRSLNGARRKHAVWTITDKGRALLDLRRKAA